MEIVKLQRSENGHEKKGNLKCIPFTHGLCKLMVNWTVAKAGQNGSWLSAQIKLGEAKMKNVLHSMQYLQQSGEDLQSDRWDFFSKLTVMLCFFPSLCFLGSEDLLVSWIQLRKYLLLVAAPLCTHGTQQAAMNWGGFSFLRLVLCLWLWLLKHAAFIINRADSVQQFNGRKMSLAEPNSVENQFFFSALEQRLLLCTV